MKRRRATILIAAVTGILGTIAFLVVTEPWEEPRERPRVVLYGDSLSVESGRYVKATLKRAEPRVEFVNRSFPGTAPCDWFERAMQDAEIKTYAVIIEAFGNNQSSCQLTEAGNRPRSEGDLYWLGYRNDLRQLIRTFPRSTRIYLTAPPAAYNDDSAGRSHSDRMYRTMTKAARGFDNAKVVDAGAAVETPAGRYTRSLPCLEREPRCEDQPKRGFNLVRAEDGLHFCPPILKATVDELERCPVYASGAWRFGQAQARPLAEKLRQARGNSGS